MHSLIALAAISIVVQLLILAALVRLILDRQQKTLWSWHSYDYPSQPCITGYITIMAEKILVGGTTTAKVNFTDSAGKSVAVASVPVWVAEPDGLVTVAPAADGLTAVVTGVAAGDVTLTVSAEGDPTPGVDPISITSDPITVALDEATGGTITFEDPS